MKPSLTRFIVVVVFSLLQACGSGSDSSESTNGDNNTPPTASVSELNVGYFLEWPTPNLIAKAQQTYQESLGIPVNWKSYQSGTAMTEAMIAGDIDMAYSQGLAPFVVAVNNGTPITTIAVAAEYAANACVSGNNSGVDASNAQSFTGKTVAVPFATMAEYSFVRQMQALGVITDNLTIVNMTAAAASEALVNGTADIACIFGQSATDTALLAGQQLMSDNKMNNAGIFAFDVISATDSIISSDAALLRAFLQVTDQANRDFQSTPDQLDIIVNESGMDQQSASDLIATINFPFLGQQSGIYIDTITTAMGVAGEVFATTEAPALPDYAISFDTSLLQ